MKTFLNIVVWLAAIFISAIFLSSLQYKFTGHPTPEHIFTILRDWSGIGLFYPAGPWIIGLAEALAAICLIALPALFLLTNKRNAARNTQMFGAVIALGVMSGAIVFHLFTPLGISTPTEWANGEPVAFSPALFISACVSWLCAVVVLLVRGKQRP
ncbi:hypothetical protein [Litorimonas haliclonae]|uniref:hypothetical protein n=1 Tax=Litorimonas haliclonae TaxID=2081977 RepID=UPI0039EF1721